MNTALKLAAIATLMAAGAAQTRADQSNLVQHISIQLFGVKQGGTSTNGNLVTTSADGARVDTKQVIQALAAATANTFSSTGKLVLVVPLGGGDPSIQVRDGSNTVDVTGFFSHQQLSDSVTSTFLNTKTGKTFETDYSIQRFVLQDRDGYPTLSLHFDVNGFAAQSSGSNAAGGQGTGLDANVAGTGDRNGKLLILQGSISIFGHTLEVVAGGGGGGPGV